MNSNAMEMEGLVRGLRKLREQFQLEIDSLVTDRHMQIAAMMRNPRSEFKDINHYFDIWHVSKCESQICILLFVLHSILITSEVVILSSFLSFAAVTKALRKIAGSDVDNGGLTPERISSITNRQGLFSAASIICYYLLATV